MRKILASLIVLGLLLSAQPARAQADPAYYAAQSFLMPLQRGQWRPLSTYTFTDTRNGVVTLDGYTFRPAAPGELVTISGTCNLKRDPAHWLMAMTVNGGTVYYLVDTASLTASFTITVPAGDIIISAYQENPDAANGIKCVLLFESKP